MAFLMTATPISMHIIHKLSLDKLGVVMQFHVVAMFLPSLVTGNLIKKFGYSKMMYAGVGLAALPEYLVSNSTNVIKVLPKSEGPITEAHFVYPQSLKNTARITSFRNFIFSKIGDWKT